MKRPSRKNRRWRSESSCYESFPKSYRFQRQGIWSHNTNAFYIDGACLQAWKQSLPPFYHFIDTYNHTGCSR